MKHTTLIAACALAFCAAVSAGAKDIEDATPKPPPLLTSDLSGSDLTCLTGAAHELEVLTTIAEMAGKHAVTPEVKAEAAAIAKEQAAALDTLKALAASLHVAVDTDLYGDDARLIETLEGINGVKFDKAYMDAQGETEQALETSLNAGAASADAGIKAFAQDGLARLKQEQDRARKLGF